MKNLLTALALSTAALATPALAQSTAVSTEVELGGRFSSTKADTTAVRAVVSHRFANNVVAEVEGRATVDGVGLDGGYARVGYQLAVAGITLTPSVEVGYQNQPLVGPDRDFATIGAGVATTVPVNDVFALTGTYRYRTDFNGGAFNQHELSAGGKVNLSENIALTGRYLYRFNKGFESDAVAAGVSFRF